MAFNLLDFRHWGVWGSVQWELLGDKIRSGRKYDETKLSVSVFKDVRCIKTL
jgi:hypothetical protein